MTLSDDLTTAAGVAQVLEDALQLSQDTSAAKDSVIADLNTTVAQQQTSILDLQHRLADCEGTVPPPVGGPRCRIGVNEGGTELEPALRMPLNVFRIFDQTDVDAWLAKGYVYLSVPSVADATTVAGRYSGAKELTLIVEHEPDAKQLSPSAYGTKQHQAEDAINGRVRFAPVILAQTWVKGNQAQWLDNGCEYDCLCVDGYLREIPWGVRGFDLVFGAAVADSKARGLPLAITEVGVPQKVDSATCTEAQQAYEIDKLHRIVSEASHVEAVCYFHESWTNVKVRDYRFSTRPTVLAAFKNMVTDPALG